MFPKIFIKNIGNRDIEKYKLIVWFYITLNWMYSLSDIVKMVGNQLRMLNISESKIGKSRELGLSMGAYAGICMAIPLFRHSIEFHEKALQLRKEMNDQWGIAQSLQLLGFCYQWKGDYEKSNNYFLESYDKFKKMGDLWEVKMVLQGMDLNYLWLGDYKKSLELIDQYLKISEQLNDNYGICSAMSDYALVNYQRGNYDQALKYAEKSLIISEEHKIVLIDCLVNIYMGNVLNEFGDYKKSIEHLERAYELYENNNLLEYYSVFIYSYLAEAYLIEFTNLYSHKIKGKKKELNKIKKLCKKALLKTRPWKAHYSETLRISARYYSFIGKTKKAERLLLQSININTKLGKPHDLALGLYEYGKLLKETGRAEEAKKRIESSYIILKEIDSKVYLKRVSDMLGINEKEEKDDMDSIQKLKYRERLSSIIKVSQTISSILNLDLLLKNIVTLAMEITGAQRGYLFIKDEVSGELVLKVKKFINEGKIDSRPSVIYSGNIVKAVFKTGEAVLLNDAEQDADYSKYNSVVLHRLKSILCVPIKHQNTILGVCYFDNPLSSSVFSAEDQEILEAIMTQAAISIENARLYEITKIMKEKAENEVEKLTIHILQKQEKQLDEKSSLVYQSPQMQEVVGKVSQAVKISRPILITGETGTGKELIAKLIHYSGKYQNEPFIALNCATIPPAIWEAELFGHVKGSFTDAKANREGRVTAVRKGLSFLTKSVKCL